MSNQTDLISLSQGDGSALTGVGKVLQVVSTEYTGTFVTTSGDYQSVYSVNITPASASSRFLLIADILRCAESWQPGPHYTALFRGATLLTEQRANNWANNEGNTAANPFSVGLSFLDAPATVSLITYSVRIASVGGYSSGVNRRADVSDQQGRSTLTVLEIS